VADGEAGSDRASKLSTLRENPSSRRTFRASSFDALNLRKSNSSSSAIRSSAAYWAPCIGDDAVVVYQPYGPEHSEYSQPGDLGDLGLTARSTGTAILSSASAICWRIRYGAGGWTGLVVHGTGLAVALWVSGFRASCFVTGFVACAWRALARFGEGATFRRAEDGD